MTVEGVVCTVFFVFGFSTFNQASSLWLENLLQHHDQWVTTHTFQAISHCLSMITLKIIAACCAAEFRIQVHVSSSKAVTCAVASYTQSKCVTGEANSNMNLDLFKPPPSLDHRLKIPVVP